MEGRQKIYRHEKLIKDIRETGARIILIPDGDISGAIAPSLETNNADLLLGTGAAPEGVIAAAAIKCLGGEIQGRLSFRNEDEKRRAKEMGIKDLEKKYSTNELVRGDNVIFSATGILSGLLLDGVQFTSTGVITHSLVTRSKSGTIRFIKANHRMDHKEHKKIAMPR